MRISEGEADRTASRTSKRLSGVDCWKIADREASEFAECRARAGTRVCGFRLAAAFDDQSPTPTVSRLLLASAEPASSASISRSSLLSVLLRQTAQATPAMQSRPTR